ncbi:MULTISPECIES: SEC-C metal-binding domain-containing protein [Oscillospiraceae]|uniref:YecA family protein n=1 Tax=Oscillospiraceae TaxID=216572 RepID=UPI001FAA8697|nr:SEC-C metal-binding domain-containing protein [Pseudoflavonifractor sp. BSD2780061688st1 E11]
MPEHPEEIKYIQENYPYNYECSRQFLERVKQDAEQTEKEVLEELQKLSDHQTIQEWKAFLENESSQMNAADRAEVLVDGWEPYRRKGVKVGRNDPCPCGSGKKYKKCCGK